MPYFSMTRAALPADTIDAARALAGTVAERTGVEKFAVASAWTDADDRQRALPILRSFLAGPAAGLFRARFGVEPALCLNITTVRRQAPGNLAAVGWHLDLGFVGDGSPFLVSWTALHDVGTERPGLDVCVPTGAQFDLSRFLAEWPRRQAEQALEFSDAELDALIGPAFWESRPLHARAGDAAVFDQFVLHRTQRLPGRHGERVSIEFRMVDIDRLPVHIRRQPAVLARLDSTGEVELLRTTAGRAAPWSIDGFLRAALASGGAQPATPHGPG